MHFCDVYLIQISIFETEDDWNRLLCGTLNVLKRREVSLNRRLYFYLLGVDPSNPTGTEVETQKCAFLSLPCAI